MRSLLLEALRAWQIRRFGRHAIEEALAYIQQKIDRFEERVCEIRGAAAGKAWLSIKQAVHDVIHKEASHACKKKPEENEQQSGMMGISWKRHTRRWRVCWQNARTGKAQTCHFPINKFLKEGCDEQTAIEAALEEAKAHYKKLAFDGTLPLPKRVPAKFSAIRGVSFDKRLAKWVVRFRQPGTRKDKRFGCFVLQEEAEAKARKIAKRFGRNVEKPMRIHS